MRVESWAARLETVIVRHQTQAFAWGETDCATLFGEAVEAVTGTDPLAAFRPWRNAAQALRIMRAAGYEDMMAFTAAHFDEIAPADVRRGDIGVVAVREALTCPSVVGGALAFGMTRDGVCPVSIDTLVRAWRVG